jgi:dTDP-4-amino-4,6-dideoxygalactose transaminase
VRTGAKPVICDVTEDGLIDISDMEKKITKKTKAVIPVHLWGYPANMVKINEIAKKHGIYVVEDAAQAHGAFTGEEFKDTAEPGAFTPKERVGTHGIAGAFSFFPGKNLGAYGDGGAVITNDESLYNEISSLKDHGRQDKYVHNKIGYNSRLDGIQAAVLSVKLQYLDRWNAARREISRKYNKFFLELKQITLPIISRGSVMHLYVIKTEKRDELLKHLNGNGIMAGIHYPVPLHLQPALKYLGYKQGDFTVSEKLSETVLSLPLFAEMSESQIAEVGNSVVKFFTQ